MARFHQIFTAAACAALAGCATPSDDALSDVTLDELQAEAEAGPTRGLSAPAPVAKPADTEAPEIFELTDTAQWDGKPTVGDIWIEVPSAVQPERVAIRNPKTGAKVQGAMFVADKSLGPNVPIRLSKGAALALGLAPNEPVTLTVTALRSVSSRPGATVPALTQPAPEYDVADTGFGAPSIDPSPLEAGYVQVAEALAAESARRVEDELRLAALPVEVQEDFVDGFSIYRVFTRAETDPAALSDALEAIRFAAEAEGDTDTDLLISDPVDVIEPEPAWMEVGGYMARNEALAVTQRLTRRGVPTVICDESRRGLIKVHRVFAGPALDTAPALGPDLADVTPHLPPHADPALLAARAAPAPEPVEQIHTASFCAGVAAADAARVATGMPALLRASPEFNPDPMAPLADGSSPATGGPVRIRVGEATGNLNIRVPEPFSEDIKLDIGGAKVTVARDTAPDVVRAIVDALKGLNLN